MRTKHRGARSTKKYRSFAYHQLVWATAVWSIDNEEESIVYFIDHHPRRRHYLEISQKLHARPISKLRGKGPRLYQTLSEPG